MGSNPSLLETRTFVLWCLICCMLSVKDKTPAPQSIHWRGHISVWKRSWTNALAAQLNNLLQLARTLILPGYLGSFFFSFLVCCFSLWSMQEGDRIRLFQTVSSVWDCHDGWARALRINAQCRCIGSFISILSDWGCHACWSFSIWLSHINNPSVTMLYFYITLMQLLGVLLYPSELLNHAFNPSDLKNNKKS